MTAGFYYEKPMGRATLAYKDQTRSHIVNGDPEKAPRPISESRERFGDHQAPKPPMATGDWSKLTVIVYIDTMILSCVNYCKESVFFCPPGKLAQIISGSTGPIFVTFSPNDRYLFVDDRYGPPF